MREFLGTVPREELLRICKTQPSSNGTTNFTTETICSVRFVPLVKDPAP